MLVECPALQGSRASQLKLLVTEATKRMDIAVWRKVYTSRELVTKLILDCSWFTNAGLLPDDRGTIATMEFHSRRLCYELHCARTHQLLRVMQPDDEGT
jgi:hypothetical protein